MTEERSTDDLREDILFRQRATTTSPWYEEQFASRAVRHAVEYLVEEDTSYPSAGQVAGYDSDVPLDPDQRDVTEAVNELAGDLDGIDGEEVWWSETGRRINGDLLRHELNNTFGSSDFDPELKYSDVL